MKLVPFTIKAFVVLAFITGLNTTKAQIVPREESCTIGAAAAKATSDGRPMIWKTVDGGGSKRVLEYVTAGNYKFICDNLPGRVGATSMGLNEMGFAILNSQSGDLSGASNGYGNTSFMWAALGKCASLSDLEKFLDSTNVTGRKTTTNFAAMDSTGAVALYEVDGNQYWKFDANDTSVAPDGYIIRANFSMNGGGNEGLDRYNRSSKLIAGFYAGDSLNYKSILRYQMRDFSDRESNPIPIPYAEQWAEDIPFGYIFTNNSICRYPSLSSAVFQGILPGEPVELSTMWELLGQPASTITVPYWPVGDAPELAFNAPTARLCDIAVAIKSFLFDYSENNNYIDTYKLRDENGSGLWATTFAAEDSIFTATEEKLQQWRTGTFSIEEMLAAEAEFARYAYSKLRSLYDRFLTFNNTNIEVSKSYAPYIEIVDVTLLSSGDDKQSVVTLPFTFVYDGIQYDQIQVSTNGWLELGRGEAGSDSGLSTAEQLSYVGAINNERLASTERPTKVLAPWWDDLTTGDDGQIAFRIEGSAPQRRLIVQWKNMRAYSSGSTTSISFQVHLMESGNSIEFHYGPLKPGTYSGDGASMGFKDLKGGGLRFYDLKQNKICYKDELIAALNPNQNWPGPDSSIIIKTYGLPTPVKENIATVPQDVHLYQNYPNPFNPKTVISYRLAVYSKVELNIYNILGQKVATLVNKKQAAGRHTVEWHAGGLAGGVYFYRLKTDNGCVQSRKALLLK